MFCNSTVIAKVALPAPFLNHLIIKTSLRGWYIRPILQIVSSDVSIKKIKYNLKNRHNFYNFQTHAGMCGWTKWARIRVWLVKCWGQNLRWCSLSELWKCMQSQYLHDVNSGCLFKLCTLDISLATTQIK